MTRIPGYTPADLQNMGVTARSFHRRSPDASSALEHRVPASAGPETYEPPASIMPPHQDDPLSSETTALPGWSGGYNKPRPLRRLLQPTPTRHLSSGFGSILDQIHPFSSRTSVPYTLSLSP